MSWEQRNADFCNAQTDAQMAYIEAEREVDRLQAENAKLRELVEYMHCCFVRGHDWGPYCAGETVWVEQRMRELGIEAD